MAQSFKYKDNTFIDSTGIVHNRKLLSEILNDLIAHKSNEETIFTGTADGVSAISINKSWEKLGKFKRLFIQLNYEGWNEITSCYFNFEDLTTGNDVYHGKRNSNVYSSPFNMTNSIKYLGMIPSTSITENGITVGLTGIKIKKIWVEY